MVKRQRKTQGQSFDGGPGGFGGRPFGEGQMPEGMEPPKDGQFPGGKEPPEGNANVELSEYFKLSAGANYFSNVQVK